MFGYDIAHVPRPPFADGPKRSMYNFRAVCSPTADKIGEIGLLDMARSMPLPGWRPPPH
jgi:hypothetical protein